jgi:hypothetical protein
MDAPDRTDGPASPSEPLARAASAHAASSAPMSKSVRTKPPKSSWFASHADRFGATASFLCAVHCAALPLVIAVLPAIGLGFLANHRFERGFVAFASVLAMTTLIVGFRRHRQFRAFWFLVPGILLLAAGMIVDFDQSATLHATLVALGGTLVAASHVANLRLAHVHVHTAACEH